MTRLRREVDPARGRLAERDDQHVALVAAVMGAIAEMVSDRDDDNLTLVGAVLPGHREDVEAALRNLAAELAAYLGDEDRRRVMRWSQKALDELLRTLLAWLADPTPDLAVALSAAADAVAYRPQDPGLCTAAGLFREAIAVDGDEWPVVL